LAMVGYVGNGRIRWQWSDTLAMVEDLDNRIA
jgi:hypothetical protein